MTEPPSMSLDRRLDLIESRLTRIEAMLHIVITGGDGVAFLANGPIETPAPPWEHLVVRRHPWRKQLYIKGRNMTVRHLIGSVIANKMTHEEGAANLDLPLEAVREAFSYAEKNPEVLALDQAYENYLRANSRSSRAVRAVHG